jgi:uncharacterized protein (DUF433 family)
MLDWSQCPAVESFPGKVSGAWVFRGTRTPVQPIFESLELGENVGDILNTFDVTEEQIRAVLAFAAKSRAAISAWLVSRLA